MKNIKKIQKTYFERAATQLTDERFEVSTQTLTDLHVMHSSLLEIERRARQIDSAKFAPLIEVVLPTHRDFKTLPCSERLKASALELLNYFYQFNIVVWRAGHPFEPSTSENEMWRALGTQLHEWYEVLKRQILINLGLYNGQYIDPFFNEIFLDGLKRANAGEDIAIKYLRIHWGMLQSEIPDQATEV